MTRDETMAFLHDAALDVYEALQMRSSELSPPMRRMRDTLGVALCVSLAEVSERDAEEAAQRWFGLTYAVLVERHFSPEPPV